MAKISVKISDLWVVASPNCEVNPTVKSLLYLHTSLAHGVGAILDGYGHTATEHVLGGIHNSTTKVWLTIRE